MASPPPPYSVKQLGNPRVSRWEGPAPAPSEQPAPQAGLHGALALPDPSPPPQKKAAAEAAPGVPPPGEDKHTGRRVGALRRQTPRAARPLRRGTGGTPGSPAPPSHPPQTRRKKILRRRKRRRKILRRRKDTLQAEGRLRARRFLHGRCLPAVAPCRCQGQPLARRGARTCPTANGRRGAGRWREQAPSGDLI